MTKPGQLSPASLSSLCFSSLWTSPFTHFSITMKVFACVLALCLVAAVFCQNPPNPNAAAAAAAAAAASAGNQPMVGGATNSMGLGQLLTLGTLTGGIGNDAFGRMALCNMMMGGSNSLLCLTSLMQ